MIVTAFVADSGGVRGWVSETPGLDGMLTNLLNNVDLEVDHRKVFDASERTLGHTICYVVDDAVLFLCVAEEGFPIRTCFTFLTSLANVFHSDEGKIGPASRRTKVERFLEGHIEYFNEDPDADRYRSLYNKIDDVATILHENVETMLERDQQAEEMREKAEKLGKQTAAFEHEATKAKKKSCLETWCYCFFWCKCCWAACDVCGICPCCH